MEIKIDKVDLAKDCIRPLASILNPNNSFPPSLTLPDLDNEYAKYNVEKCYIILQNQFTPALAVDFMYRLDEFKRRLATWRQFVEEVGADRSWNGKELNEYLLGKKKYSIQIDDEVAIHVDLEDWYNNLNNEFGKIHKYLLKLANEIESQIPMRSWNRQYLMPLHFIPNYFKISRETLYKLAEKGRLKLYHDEKSPPLVDATIITKYAPLLIQRSDLA